MLSNEMLEISIGILLLGNAILFLMLAWLYWSLLDDFKKLEGEKNKPDI